MAETMKAIRFSEYGGPEELALETIDRPKPGTGEVVVKVMFAGVNPVDWKFRAGYMKDFVPLELPYTPGIDISGVVAEIGDGVEKFAAGDPVFGVARGGYAEYAVAGENDIARKPESVSFEAAATIPVGALTGRQAVLDVGIDADSGGGKTVLVQGAAGGVGMFAAQFAHLAGATVLGTASGGNLEFLQSIGVDTPIDYSAGSVADSIDAVDVVIDTVGGDVLKQSYRLVRPGGMLTTVAGAPSDEQAKERGITARRSGRGSAEALTEIAAQLERGDLQTEVQKIFPLAQARAAQELCQSGHGRGRILLKVAA